MVLMVIIVGLGLAGATVVATVATQRSTVRDQHSKAALAAADAGAEVALLRQNTIDLDTALPCIVRGLGDDLLPGLAGPDGWCPAQTGTVGSASYTYRVKPVTLVGTLLNQREAKIVSVGTSGGVSRRIAITARAHTGAALFGDAAVKGLDDVVVYNNSNVVGNVASNGPVYLRNEARLCGDVTTGVGQDFQREGGIWCPGFTDSEAMLQLPLPDLTAVRASNDNYRLGPGPPTPADRITPPQTNHWNSTTRTLTLNGNDTLTLGGANYLICRLEMLGSASLIAARGSTIRIYFDDQNCPGVTEPVVMTGNTKILTTSQQPGDLAFIVAGSGRQINITGTGNVQTELTIYAPRSTVNVTGTTSYVGSMAGQHINLGGSALISADPSVSAFGLGVLLLYERERYVECVGGTMPTTPDSNC